LAAAFFGHHGKNAPINSAAVDTAPISGRVQWVTDGDTFALNDYKIRLWGIDAPERDTTFGPAATRALTSAVRGKELTCQPVDKNHDRVVAQCKVGTVDLSAALVFGGWARDLPTKSGGAHAKLESAAKAAGKGMWKSSEI
jgi:endonuclease YncB( thermonuclease family)